jgi:hypothetical protein
MQAKSKTQNTTGRSKSDDKNKENVSKKGKTEVKAKKRSKSRTQDEMAPKKPLSAYMQWSLAERKKLKEEGVEGKDIMRELGQRWKKTSEEDRKKWEDLYERDKERYEREMKEDGLPLLADKKAKTEAKQKGDKKAGYGKKSEKDANKGKKSTDDKDKRKKDMESNKKACGLCGKTKRLTKTECCNNWICDDQDKYVLFSYATNTCNRNHDRYTLCSSHYHEEHEGKWQDCQKCKESFKLEDYAYYVTNDFNFEKLKDAPNVRIKCVKCDFESDTIEDFAVGSSEGWYCGNCQEAACIIF